ncbi:MAG: TonB-dependent receptor, partial [Proteobacteria bacterium]|nr:TonB-dependent receptor [Pseudomonadota bacterium]
DAAVLTEVQVTAHRLDEARNGLMPEVGASEYRLGADDIKNLPLGESTPLNQVLLRAPGVTQDSYGQLHVRGDHANLQYRINDVVIPESISLFGQALNPRFASEINLLTGALPAQYGYRTAGVVDIHTKGSDYRQGGELNVLAGSRDHREVSGELSGNIDGLSVYATGGHVANDLGIENPLPTRDALHDHTDQWNGFGYLSYVLPTESRLSLMLGESNDTFQIPDVPGQAARYVPPGATAPDSATLDERQHEGNRFAILAYENATTEVLHYQVAFYDRFTDVHYRPDPAGGDLAFAGAAGDIARSNQRWGMQADASWKARDTHTLRFGATYNDERARTLASTTVYPLDALGDVVYAPATIADNSEDRARLWGGYLQDEWKPLEPLTVNVGLRYDRYQGLTDENQLSPRLGIVYELGMATLHAGYARYFTPPPTEKIRVETIGLFAGTTGAPASTGNDPVRSERSHYYDVGVLLHPTAALSLGLDAYYREVRELGDEGQFGSALIFAPFNYERGRVWGLEFSGSWRGEHASAYLNAATGAAEGTHIVSGQYNFAADELAAIASQWVHLDHDQRVTASSGVSRTWRGTTLSADALFGSGLRRGYLNADHLPSYLTLNLALRRSAELGPLGVLDWELSVLNVLDRVYELRDGSGIGVGAPQWGLRRTLYVGLGKPFGR